MAERYRQRDERDQQQNWRLQEDPSQHGFSGGSQWEGSQGGGSHRQQSQNERREQRRYGRLRSIRLAG
jgi:hypothetical protein